jgi:hypothetical protein
MMVICDVSPVRQKLFGAMLAACLGILESSQEEERCISHLDDLAKESAFAGALERFMTYVETNSNSNIFTSTYITALSLL